MTISSYQNLALEWSLQRPGDRQFSIITLVVVTMMIGLGVLLSSIQLPHQPREARKQIPERIANFLLEKKKAQPKIEKPKPEVIKPKPEPKSKPKPRVKKDSKKSKITKPLTKKEKQAREKAAESGLLALSNELADLMDTSDISAMVGGSISSSAVQSDASANETSRDLLIAEAGKGSRGVDMGEYQTRVGKTPLSKRKISRINQSLVEETAKPSTGKTSTKSATEKSASGIRSEEEITLVFDQKKGQLFSLYNRARRKNPGLKGKIIFQLTIAPSGKVDKLEVLSSELNDKRLEKSLIRRIKQFDFGTKAVKVITVTYPIEFLPA